VTQKTKTNIENSSPNNFRYRAAV